MTEIATECPIAAAMQAVVNDFAAQVGSHPSGVKLSFTGAWQYATDDDPDPAPVKISVAVVKRTKDRRSKDYHTHVWGVGTTVDAARQDAIKSLAWHIDDGFVLGWPA